MPLTYFNGWMRHKFVFTFGSNFCLDFKVLFTFSFISRTFVHLLPRVLEFHSWKEAYFWYSSLCCRVGVLGSRCGRGERWMRIRRNLLLKIMRRRFLQISRKPRLPRPVPRSPWLSTYVHASYCSPVTICKPFKMQWAPFKALSLVHPCPTFAGCGSKSARPSCSPPRTFASLARSWPC